MIQSLQIFSKLLRHQSCLKTNFPQSRYETKKANQTTEDELKSILEKKFPDATVIQVDDVSGGCGAMYNIYIETKDFEGISIAKQHQAVYAALHEQIKLMHGLHVVTKVPS